MSAPRATVVPATLELASQLAVEMRPEDAAECRAGGLEPLQAVLDSIRTSDIAQALVLEGKVAGMFGVGPLAGVADRVGHVWFLTGHLFAQRPLAFVRFAKPAVAAMLELYPVLFNVIDARYSAAVRWVKWLGFDVGEPRPFGPAGVLFVPAQLRRA